MKSFAVLYAASSLTKDIFITSLKFSCGIPHRLRSNNFVIIFYLNNSDSATFSRRLASVAKSISVLSIRQFSSSPSSSLNTASE
ncbi:hypothetical protein DLP04_25925 [Salmonella enterica]|nr:endoribonuclease GhoS [Salmonella enterica]MLT78439.1 hypothetical protein [Salmonella enterica subsp. enterica serovar Sandiego]EBI9418485.1 hypothetical protein [Salmonella enterica]EBT7965296.1 type V toxin-antitoxin system endoribonuclease antitoxin GhoS [Salmonella enterica]ECP4146872.1 type V toxin-antitoxin system endoribonuclease antitoxin GhoS [Salmonella enterica]